MDRIKIDLVARVASSFSKTIWRLPVLQYINFEFWREHVKFGSVLIMTEDNAPNIGGEDIGDLGRIDV